MRMVGVDRLEDRAIDKLSSESVEVKPLLFIIPGQLAIDLPMLGVSHPRSASASSFPRLGLCLSFLVCFLFSARFTGLGVPKTALDAAFTALVALNFLSFFLFGTIAIETRLVDNRHLKTLSLIPYLLAAQWKETLPRRRLCAAQIKIWQQPAGSFLTEAWFQALVLPGGGVCSRPRRIARALQKYWDLPVLHDLGVCHLLRRRKQQSPVRSHSSGHIYITANGTSNGVTHSKNMVLVVN